jgi:cytochrome P450
VIASAVLGVERAHEDAFRKFAVAVAAATSAPWLSAEEVEALTAPVPPGIELVRAMIEERRARPKGDLLTTLIELEEQGDRLSTAELLSVVASLIIAGSETTVHAIAFGALDLLRHPDQLALVLADPVGMRSAVDELLRFGLFGRIGAHRFALEDIELHGRSIQKGQMCLLLVASALRDETAFADPDRLDVKHEIAQTIAFGAGPHYCLGASLARLELETALGALFRRFPKTTLDGEPQYAPHLTMRALASLPVKLG